MPEKPHAPVRADTIFATKDGPPAPAEAVEQPKPAREDLVHLNFKVDRTFRRRFKHLAVDRGVTGRELLRRALAAYEHELRRKQ